MLPGPDLLWLIGGGLASLLGSWLGRSKWLPYLAKDLIAPHKDTARELEKRVRELTATVNAKDAELERHERTLEAAMSTYSTVQEVARKVRADDRAANAAEIERVQAAHARELEQERLRFQTVIEDSRMVFREQLRAFVSPPVPAGPQRHDTPERRLGRMEKEAEDALVSRVAASIETMAKSQGISVSREQLEQEARGMIGRDASPWAGY